METHRCCSPEIAANRMGASKRCNSRFGAFSFSVSLVNKPQCTNVYATQRMSGKCPHGRIGGFCDPTPGAPPANLAHHITNFASTAPIGKRCLSQQRAIAIVLA